MERKTAFIGHRNAYLGLKGEERLREEVEKQISSGCKCFTMGTHGSFDNYALSVCRALKKKYPDIIIEVVISELRLAEYIPYKDVQTVMYNVEETHYKRRITVSNRRMIDGCDTLICYVYEYRNAGGAKATLNYAKRKGLKIINLSEY